MCVEKCALVFQESSNFRYMAHINKEETPNKTAAQDYVQTIHLNLLPLRFYIDGSLKGILLVVYVVRLLLLLGGSVAVLQYAAAFLLQRA